MPPIAVAWYRRHGIISIVIYNGETKWEKTSMLAYFGNPHQSLHSFIPQFDYLLFDLSGVEDHQIENFKNDLRAHLYKVIENWNVNSKPLTTLKRVVKIV